MPELSQEYLRARALLENGQLQQAADICKQMLLGDPNSAHGYHLMSALFRVTGNLEKALQFSHTAIRLSPANPSFYVQQGKVLSALGAWKDAAHIFEKAHDLEPAEPLPLLLWAKARSQEKEFDAALALLERARMLGDCPEADEEEALCRIMMGDELTAEALFDRVIARCPTHMEAYLHKGWMLLGQGRDMKASACFARALKLSPQAHEVLHGMSIIDERQGQTELAIGWALKAVQVNASARVSLMLLGNLLMRRQSFPAAEEVFRQALMLSPDHIYVLHGLMQALSPRGRVSEVIPYIERALTLKPDSRALRHLRDMARHKTVSMPPYDYTGAWFDAYREQFGPLLQDRLAAQLPGAMAQALQALPNFPAGKELRLLDLGCGNGGVAEALRDRTGLRIGVDLSQSMLDYVRRRGLYSEVYALDMVEFMRGSDRAFDVTLAVDVLPHSGDLLPFMEAARNVMAPDGLLGFTIEMENSDLPFRLHVSGRYTHHPDYIYRLAHECGLSVLSAEERIMRMEGLQPIGGALFILKKLPAH